MFKKFYSIKKFLPLILSLSFLLLIMMVSTCFQTIKFIYNNTDSLPRGIYYIYKKNNYTYGDIVCLEIPDSVKKIVFERKYLPAEKSYFLKPVKAIYGDYVCVKNWEFSINNQSTIKIKKYDSQGNPLPEINFCEKLLKNQFFLASSKTNSFDSRYYGAIDESLILGVATPVWIFSNNKS